MAVKLEKKHYKYMIGIIAGSVLFSVLIAIFIIRPLYNANAETNKEINEKREVLSALEDRLNTLKELKDDEARLISEKEKVLAALPESKDVSRLFIQFENMVSGTGASVEKASEQVGSTTVSTGTDTSEASLSGIQNHNYNINFNTSTYESIKNVIVNSEQALRLVNLGTMNIEFKDNSFSVEFGLNTYSRVEEE